MSNPLVSVRMITYNHAPYIRRMIESALSQKTDFPFEVVIGEDCSTDGTREIVFDYAEKYPEIIRLVTSDQNVGMHENSRRAFEACRGQYVAYCDGDDYWLRDDKLKKQADYLEGNPNCGLVCSDYDVHHVDTDLRIKNYVRHRGWQVPTSRSVEDYIVAYNAGRIGSAILTCTVMLRRELVERVKTADPYLFEEGAFLMGDTQLWVEINALSEVAFIPESLATYNILAESASQSKDVTKNLCFQISKADLFLYLGKKHNVSLSVLESMENYRHKCMLRLAFKKMNAALAEEVKEARGLKGFKERLMYLGARNAAAHSVLNLISSDKKNTEKSNEWM